MSLHTCIPCYYTVQPVPRRVRIRNDRSGAFPVCAPQRARLDDAGADIIRQAGDRRSPLRPPGQNVLFRRGRRPRRPARDAPIRRRWAALPTAEMKKLPNFPPEWGETVESAPFSGRFHPKKIDITVTEGVKISKLVDIITICRNFFSLFDEKLPAVCREVSKTINLHKHNIL